MQDWKVVRVSSEQYKWLKDQKDTIGIPISETVKRAIENYKTPDGTLTKTRLSQHRYNQLIDLLCDLLPVKRIQE